MPEFRLTLLGAFAFSGGAPCMVPSRKGQALLALLAIPPGRTHRRDKLATMLWSGHSDEAARQNLRQCLTALRKGCQNGAAIPLIAEGDLLRLDAAQVIVDVGEFEDAMRGRDPAALARAFTLYRGELLEGLNFDECPFEEWLIGERRRLNALAIEGLNQLLRHQQWHGEREAAMQTALRLLTIDPVQEDVHRSLMRLHREIGNTAQALGSMWLAKRLYAESSALNRRMPRMSCVEDLTEPERCSLQRPMHKTEPAGDDHFSPRMALKSRAKQMHLPLLPGTGHPSPCFPLRTCAGNAEQDYFSDGITEDIITELSRFSELFVIARNSSFVYKGKSVDVRQIGRELGVRYVLEGSVRKSGNRVRITGQLVDTTKGVHIWADRFDGAMEDIFDLQEKMSTIILGAIAPKLELAEIDRARRKPTESLDVVVAWLLYGRSPIG